MLYYHKIFKTAQGCSLNVDEIKIALSLIAQQNVGVLLFVFWLLLVTLKKKCYDLNWYHTYISIYLWPQANKWRFLVITWKWDRNICTHALFDPVRKTLQLNKKPLRKCPGVLTFLSFSGACLTLHPSLACKTTQKDQTTHKYIYTNTHRHTRTHTLSWTDVHNLHAAKFRVCLKQSHNEGTRRPNIVMVTIFD